MTRSIALAVFLSLQFLLASTHSCEPEDARQLQGTWTPKAGTQNGDPVTADELRQGVLSFGDGQIQIGSGKSGTYHLPGPSQIDITVDSRTQRGIYEIEPPRLRICLSAPGGGRPRSFAAPAGSNAVLLILEKTAESTELDLRPQYPQPPYPYEALEVTYENPRSGIRFAGTLTLPHQGAPFPAALLITGSGQQDRDETHKGHKPFLVLADYLTRRGVAVLRVDDREKGGTTGSAAHATSADFAEDVLAGVDFLKRRPDIQTNQIGLIGHSEGGLIAPIAATKSGDVAFVVMMAGPGLPGDEVLYIQDELLSRSRGAKAETIASYRRFQDRSFEILKSDVSADVAEERIRKIVTEEMSGVSTAEKAKLATQTIVVDGRYNRTHRGELSPWFRFFLKHDPRETLRRVECPVLAIIGSNDAFVPPRHLAEIDKALRAGGNQDFLVKELPGLNHMFQTATTEANERYRETLAPIALKTIGDWITARTAPAAGTNGGLTDQLDRYVRQAVSDWEVPGLAIGVVAGDTTFARGYGVRELGGKETVDADTLFQIGSTTKAMTAATVGLLVDDRVLDWDDRVVDHLAGFRLKDPYATRELRIRDLLTHRAGLPNTDYLWQPVARPRREMLTLLRDVEPAYSFRSDFIYQNVMYVAAGELVAVASGTPWETFIKQRLFEPIGMSRTAIDIAEARIRGNLASDHRRPIGGVEVMEQRHEAADQALRPAGTVWSSANDMTRWLRLILNRGKHEEQRVLSEDVIDELLRPQTVIQDEIYPSMQLVKPHWTTYALGWFQVDYGGRAVSFHTGSYAGMAAIVGVIPDESLGVVVLTNLDHAEVRHALMWKVFDMFGRAGAQRDWSGNLRELYAKLEEKSKRRRLEHGQRRVADTQPTLPIEKYTGTFSHRLRGDLEVLERDGRLQLRWGWLQGELEHWHFDTFRWHWREGAPLTLLRFEIDNDGDVARVVQEGGIQWQRKGQER